MNICLKNLKKLMIIFFFMLILVFLVIIFNKDGGKNELSVCNWGNFISDGSNENPDVNNLFKMETGISVDYQTFQTNEELFAKMISGSANYDVITCSDYMISKLIENNMLNELNFDNISNINLIRKDFLNLGFDPESKYSVPYIWGLIGIFYNKKAVLEKEINWNILWNEKYEKQILMFDNPRDAFGISLLRSGSSINSSEEKDWTNAAKELSNQNKLVQTYGMDQILDKLINEEALIAPYYSGDASYLLSMNPNLGFKIPESGTIMFIDSLCIPKNSKHKLEAEKYINFLCRTDIALMNAKYIEYCSPQIEVYKKLYNPISYLNENERKKSQIFLNLNSKISEIIDNSWIEIKVGIK
ncbi:MAG: spermidine/putrescine ABC transporter substrate-binding protein [Candidatus Paraimprobicoccus trichonymphae]|uniref:Spermidine/putrescine ABC transporter substrate-binding protein n=1 Tax=Candidatus Paraimprobicoccus trichonymphae TaxID=3033793 RepID=A0AA48L1G1_9FIRM|nr:MAG: spermidine/putrescine ABC transporter substrate-binding protein [Candidatus Paraimprobicoccus trichonymphae]